MSNYGSQWDADVSQFELSFMVLHRKC